MFKAFMCQLVKLSRKCPWAKCAGVAFFSSVDDLDVSQELDLRGQPFAALVARPLLLVAVEINVQVMISVMKRLLNTKSIFLSRNKNLVINTVLFSRLQFQ
jgi:hypothetical protein